MSLAEFRFSSSGEEATFELGRVLGNELTAGSVLVLTGQLGAGKTRLVQGIAAGLGIDRLEVGSPTFVLIHEYAGRLPVYHFDVYRLRDTEEFLELGAEEYLHSEGVCLIEWGEQVAEVLPEDRLTVVLEISGPSERLVHFSASGPRSKALLEAVRLQAPGE